MSTAESSLLVWSLAAGWAAPALLNRATWTQRAPRLAIAAWLALLVSPAPLLAMTVHQLFAPTGHEDDGPADWLDFPYHATTTDNRGHEQLALLLLAALALLAGITAMAWRRNARQRAAHWDAVRLVARASEDGDWWMIDDPRPAAYCLAGKDGPVVLTRGALERLTPQQRDAVLSHERAHLSGRHHLLSAVVADAGRLLPWLPLTRYAAAQVPPLIEMAADDAALRTCAPRTLAEALAALASGPAPSTGLSAGTSAVTRARRILGTPHGLSRSARWAGWALVTLLPLAPVALACGP